MGVMDLREQKSLNEDTMSETMKKFCTDCKTTKTPLWRGGPSGPCGPQDQCKSFNSRDPHGMKAFDGAIHMYRFT
ncbi:hypothetical protein J1N35_036059 [Gossypium stocksii]|uniref:GATA-type domain-containing protein n=1 Tax=Gossypium stocksii TaxID=47602 RepID=A0A9D3UWU2_9ROSI|nr:hypothetical protein J1N35_036059 [Gossypium stocksii]